MPRLIWVRADIKHTGLLYEQKLINYRDQQWAKDKCVAYMCLRAASGVIDTHPDPQWGSDRGRESLLGLPAAVG